MSKEMRHAILQVTLLLLMLTGVAASGTGNSCCDIICGTGSDHEKTASGGSAIVGTNSAMVERWHDFSVGDSTLNAKDLAYLGKHLPGNVIFGLQVPTAPGASRPGTLAGEDNELVLGFGGKWREYDIPLVSHETLADQMAGVLPTDPGAHWQALVPANNDYIASIPTETTTFTQGNGYFRYALDFHDATDSCNGCVIELTVCVPTSSLPGGRLASSLLLKRSLKRYGIHSNGELTCMDPIPTVIRLSGFGGDPLPSPLVAWLSPWGGPLLKTTSGPSVELQYALGHSGDESRTFDLEPVQSDMGWSYGWYDLENNPITQMEVASGTDPWAANIKVVGTIPENALGVDRIHLTATSSGEPSLQAVAVSHVGVYPDPAVFMVADLGISKVASGQVISAGGSVDFTLTITNHENVAVSAVVTDTLTPQFSIAEVTLPPGCERDGATIICRVTDIQPGKSATVVYTVDTATTFSGTLNNSAVVAVDEGVDMRAYDNRAGPVYVTVEGIVFSLYMPVIAKP